MRSAQHREFLFWPTHRATVQIKMDPVEALSTNGMWELDHGDPATTAIGRA